MMPVKFSVEIEWGLNFVAGVELCLAFLHPLLMAFLLIFRSKTVSDEISGYR